MTRVTVHVVVLAACVAAGAFNIHTGWDESNRFNILAAGFCFGVSWTTFLQLWTAVKEELL